MFQGAIVVGMSRTKDNVSLSSTEANYVAAGGLAKEMQFLRGILAVVYSDDEQNCTTGFQGDQVAIQLANNPLGHGRSKHIDVRHHCFRELVCDSKILFEYIRSEEQHIDSMDKSFHGARFEYRRSVI